LVNNWPTEENKNTTISTNYLFIIITALYQREYKIQYFQELLCYYTPKELYNTISWYNTLCIIFKFGKNVSNMNILVFIPRTVPTIILLVNSLLYFSSLHLFGINDSLILYIRILSVQSTTSF